MAEKFKKRLSRRAQERLNRALRSFDLTMLGILAVVIVCTVICYFRGADLKAHASSGFAYWFLVVTGYLPMLLINAVRAIFKMPIPATGEHAELFIHGIADVVWVAILWLTIRIAGKRNTKSQMLHISTRLAQIMLCWGVFQLCCVAIAIGWNRGGSHLCRGDRAAAKAEEQSAEPKAGNPVAAPKAEEKTPKSSAPPPSK